MVTFIYDRNEEVMFLENFEYYKNGIGFKIPVVSLKIRYNALQYLSMQKKQKLVKYKKLKTLPYCNIYFLEKIFKLNINEDIYNIECIAFMKAILTNSNHCEIDYYKYINDICNTNIETWDDIYNNEVLYQNINFKMFSNLQLEELTESSKKEAYYHEEIASFCIFDYYSNNVKLDMMPIFTNYFKNYSESFNKHLVWEKSNLNQTYFNDFLYSFIQNSKNEIEQLIKDNDKKKMLENKEHEETSPIIRDIVEHQDNTLDMEENNIDSLESPLLTVTNDENIKDEEKQLEVLSNIINNEDKTEETMSSEDDSGMCCICYEEKANVCYDKCKHVPICVKCLYNSIQDKYLNQNILEKFGFPKCPLCRDLTHSVKIVYLN